MEPEKWILKFICKTIELRRIKVLQKTRCEEELAVLSIKVYKIK